MRPKKICLCAGSDGNTLSVLVFLLNTMGYCAIEAASEKEAAVFASENQVDILLSLNEIKGSTGDRLIHIIKKICPATPSILIRPAADANPGCQADAQIDKPWNAAELLERVKVMTARKRGPKKPVVSERSPAISQQLSAIS